MFCPFPLFVTILQQFLNLIVCPRILPKNSRISQCLVHFIAILLISTVSFHCLCAAEVVGSLGPGDPTRPNATYWVSSSLSFWVYGSFLRKSSGKQRHCIMIMIHKDNYKCKSVKTSQCSCKEKQCSCFTPLYSSTNRSANNTHSMFEV